MPPKGLAKGKLDAIQKELLNLAHQLQSLYSPVSQPYLFDEKHILSFGHQAETTTLHIKMTKCDIGISYQSSPWLKTNNKKINMQL